MKEKMNSMKTILGNLTDYSKNLSDTTQNKPVEQQITHFTNEVDAGLSALNYEANSPEEDSQITYLTNLNDQRWMIGNSSAKTIS